MTTRSLIVGLALALILVVGGTYVLRELFLPEEVVENTQETSQEEQGDTSEETLLHARIQQTVSGFGVTIVPLEVLEDSRCPIDVQCIQAGTVRVRAQLISGLGTSVQEFTLGSAVTTETESIILTDVAPQPHAGTTIKPMEYQFTFKVMKRTVPAEGKG